MIFPAQFLIWMPTPVSEFEPDTVLICLKTDNERHNVPEYLTRGGLMTPLQMRVIHSTSNGNALRIPSQKNVMLKCMGIGTRLCVGHGAEKTMIDDLKLIIFFGS